MFRVPNNIIQGELEVWINLVKFLAAVCPRYYNTTVGLIITLCILNSYTVSILIVSLTESVITT